MRIPNELLKCVCFLCVKIPDIAGEQGGKFAFAGTAFIVSKVELPDWTFPYLVTARHIIDDLIKRGYKELYVRLNTKQGKFDYIQVGIDWLIPRDKAIDLALIPFAPNPDVFDFRTLDTESLATNETLNKYNIGIGDELFVTGLFTLHTGKQRNIPIVRTGIISAMLDEPFYDKGKPYYAYLAELRSIGGLSGSPVFVHIDRLRAPLPEGTDFEFFILGIIRGHWNLKKELGEATADSTEFEYLENIILDMGINNFEKLNTGIAVITPAQYIGNIIDDEILKLFREKDISKYNSEIQKDSDSDFTRDDFLNDLKKVSRKTKKGN